MKFITKLFFLLLITGCKTIYLSPYIVGEIKSDEQPIQKVKIHFMDSINPIYYSDKNGTFEIQPKTHKKTNTAELSLLRQFNTPFIVFEKENFVTDTIDIRKYKYNKSIYVLDTLRLDTIHLKPLK